MNHLAYLNLFLEEKEQILYHTTLAKNVTLILRDGIVSKKKGLTSGMFGQDVRAAVAIFAFENKIDAQRWAAKVNWGTKEKTAIIPFKTDIDEWTEDTHWEAGLGKGRWLYRKKAVSSKDILKDKIEYPDKKTWKMLVKELDKEYK